MASACIFANHIVKILYIIVCEGVIVANNQQQEKRNRQNEKRRARNVQIKSSVRTAAKKIVKALETKESKGADEIVILQNNFAKTIDTAVQKGVIHKKTASRKKSRLAMRVNDRLKQQA